MVLLIIGYVGILAYQNISQYQRFKVNGQSMNPTLKDGQKLIMKKFQKNDKLHRGDVVIIKVTLKDKEYDFIKRVIALPGEHLEIKNHKVYINGKYLEDEGSTMGEEDCVIPDDSIYVMGVMIQKMRSFICELKASMWQKNVEDMDLAVNC